MNKKAISLLTFLTMSSTIITPGIIANAQSMDPTNLKSQTTIQSALKSQKSKEIYAMLKKVSPYLTKKNGKVTLTTHDTKKLGLSSDEIQQFEQGLNLASQIKVSITKNSSKTNDIGKNDSSQINSIRTYISGYDDGDTFHVTIPSSQVKIGLVLAGAVGLAVGLYGALSGDDEVLIIGEFMCYRDDFCNALGQIITYSAGAIGTLWSGGDLHLDIPDDIFGGSDDDICYYNDEVSDSFYY